MRFFFNLTADVFFFLSLVAVRAEHPEQRPCAKRISNVIKEGGFLKTYGDKAQNVPRDCKECMLDQRPEDADNGPDNSGQKAIVETCKIFVKALYKDIAGAVTKDNDRILDAIPERQPITDIQIAEHIGIPQNIKTSA